MRVVDQQKKKFVLYASRHRFLQIHDLKIVGRLSPSTLSGSRTRRRGTARELTQITSTFVVISRCFQYPHGGSIGAMCLYNTRNIRENMGIEMASLVTRRVWISPIWRLIVSTLEMRDVEEDIMLVQFDRMRLISSGSHA